MKKFLIALAFMGAVFAGLESWGGAFVPRQQISVENAQKLVALKTAYVEGEISHDQYETAKMEIFSHAAR